MAETICIHASAARPVSPPTRPGLPVLGSRTARLLAAVLSGLVLMASPGLPQVSGEVPLANDFKGLKVGVSEGGTVFIVAAVRDLGGKVALCATIWTERATNSTIGGIPGIIDSIGF